MPEKLNSPEAQPLNLHQRINEVRKEVTYIQKVKKNNMRYSVVSHDDVTAKLRPSMIKYGIAFYPVAMDAKQDGNRTEAKMAIRFVNVDQPEDFITVPSLGYGIDDTDKGPGKAISYGVKMALLKTFNLESGDDEDPDFQQDTKHEKRSFAELDKVIKDTASTAEQVFTVFAKFIEESQTVPQVEELYLHTRYFINEKEGDLRDSIMTAFAARKANLNQQTPNSNANSGII